MRRILRVLLVALVVLLAVLLVGPFFVPVPPLEGTVPSDQLTFSSCSPAAPCRFIELDGLRVHLQTAGSGGPSLVLLHGFGASVFSWREVIGPLGAGYRVAAYDRPAFGLTSRPMPGEWTGRSPYGPEANADLAVALLDALGMQQAVLVGNSAGGTLAVLLALEHPERVRALVLVDPAIYAGGSPGIVDLLASTPQMQHLGPLIARQIRVRGLDLLNLAWHDPSKITPEVLQGYQVPLQADNWDRALWELTVASHPLGLDQRLREITVPSLVITGDDDRIVPTADSIRLAGEIPRAQLVVIPNCGHVPQEECPEAFLQAVTGFLAGLPGEEK